MKKIKLNKHNSIADDLRFWIAQWMATKVYAVKVKPISKEKEKKVGKLVKEDVESNILNSKDLEEMRSHILLGKSQGLYNLANNFNPVYQFYNFTVENKKITDISQINTTFTDSFVQIALADKTAKTQELYYDQVKSLFKFIESNITDDFKFNIGYLRNGMRATSPIDKSQKVEQTFLEPRELLKFLKKIKEARFNHPNNFQTIMMLKFLCYGGLRKEELVRLQLDSYSIEDMDSDKYMKILVEGKGDKQRIVYIQYSLIKEEFEKFMAIRKDMQKDSNALFVTREGTQYSPRSVEDMVFRAYKNTGYGGRGLSVHSLRRSFATYLHANNVKLEDIAKLLGHSSTEMTETYVYLSEQKKYEVVDLLECI